MALVSYLITPVRVPAAVRPRPRVLGRRRRVPADDGGRDRRAVPARQPRSTSSTTATSSIPAMLEAIKRRRSCRSRSRPTSTGRARSAASSREALAAKASVGRPGQDPARRGRLGEHRRRDPRRRSRAGRCQLAWYNPIRYYSLGRFNHRTHRKSLIIDGRIAFTGGAGIADHWSGNARDPEHWRDMQIRIEGPAVTPLQTGFAQNWLQTTGELISGPAVLSAARSRPAHSRRRRS